jgi:dTDP-4-amino-4,6-dideoxygalactose transaminase
VYPRGTLDIGWRDLAAGLMATMRPADPATVERRIEAFWDSASPAGSAGSLACLSVRSGFDALLEALAFPAGSEILVSAITIRDMVLIIEAHGLVPVPVDLDMDTLSVTIEALERAVSPKTRALLVAHIFGSRMPLAAIGEWAHRRNLLLIEDCAQAYADRQDRGDAAADVSMFSFGPIKTNTALGGALLRFADARLLAGTRAIQAGYPRQDDRQFRKRVLKYMAIKAISRPVPFGVFAAVCRMTGRSHDAVIGGALRGFPGPELLAKIRRQPGAGLLCLLERRLTTFDRRRIERRMAVASDVIARIPQVPRPGARAVDHTHWIFPILAQNPARMISRLVERGFDATRGASSLAVVSTPPGRPDLEPVNARRAMADLLYLPISPLVRPSDLAEMARTVNDEMTAVADTNASEDQSLPPTMSMLAQEQVLR